MVRKALTHPRFSGESTDAQRGRQADQGWRKQRRLHKEARSWQKVGLDQTELAGERKEHQQNQVPVGVDRVHPPLSEPHFLYVPVGNGSALPAPQGGPQETCPERKSVEILCSLESALQTQGYSYGYPCPSWPRSGDDGLHHSWLTSHPSATLTRPYIPPEYDCLGSPNRTRPLTVKGDQGSIRTSKPALRGSEDPYSSNYLWSLLPKTRQLCRRQTPTSETELDLAAHRCCLPTWGLDRKSLKFPEPRGIVMSVSQNRWKHGMRNGFTAWLRSGGRVYHHCWWPRDWWAHWHEERGSELGDSGELEVPGA